MRQVRQKREPPGDVADVDEESLPRRVQERTKIGIVLRREMP